MPSLALFFYFSFGNPPYRYKTNHGIKGIVVEEKEIKRIVFADDLTNFLRDK